MPLQFLVDSILLQLQGDFVLLQLLPAISIFRLPLPQDVPALPLQPPIFLAQLSLMLLSTYAQLPMPPIFLYKLSQILSAFVQLPALLPPLQVVIVQLILLLLESSVELRRLLQLPVFHILLEPRLQFGRVQLLLIQLQL